MRAKTAKRAQRIGKAKFGAPYKGALFLRTVFPHAKIFRAQKLRLIIPKSNVKTSRLIIRILRKKFVAGRGFYLKF